MKAMGCIWEMRALPAGSSMQACPLTAERPDITMQSLSIWHVAILAFWAIVIVVPGWRIVEKAGYRGAWALLLLVPVVNLLAVWALAFARWPSQRAL